MKVEKKQITIPEYEYILTLSETEVRYIREFLNKSPNAMAIFLDGLYTSSEIADLVGHGNPDKSMWSMLTGVLS